MSQSISTISKITINKSEKYYDSCKKASSIDFVLHIPGYHQKSVQLNANSYVVSLSGTRKGAHCPHCGQYTSHVHSHYIRHLQALEVYDHHVELNVLTRRFRCKNSKCTHSFFSEPHAEIASRYARNTIQVNERLLSMSLKTTSRIASELLSQQHIVCSPSTCLRSIANAPLSEDYLTRPVSVGIDDLAHKKGHVYMSVVVDQLTHRPVALFKGRQGIELEHYLLANPQIQYITRDRGRCYVEAITRCLPNATQICDRFHLVKNLVDTMTDEIGAQARMTLKKVTYDYPSVEECRDRIMQRLFELGEKKHRDKLSLFIQADNFRRKGMSLAETSRLLGEHSYKISRLLYRHNSKDYMSKEQRLILKYADDLALEISRGCVVLKELNRKMDGKMDQNAIAHATLGLRNWIKSQRDEVKKHNRDIVEKKSEKQVSVKNIRSFILTGESKTQALNKLIENPQTKLTMKLCREFRQMVNGNIMQISLDKWIIKAKNSDSPALRAFATGIKIDQQAVQATMDIYLNNGLLEGTVNKVKCIKRQMFNRAGINLLKAKLIAYKT